MPGEFDMGAAVSAVSEGLGFDSGSAGNEGAEDIDFNDVPAGDPPPPGGDEGLGNGETVNEEVAAPIIGPDGKPVISAAPAPGANAAPKTWRPEAAAEWAKIPPVVQAEIAKREEDMFQGIAAYKNDAVIGQSLQRTLAPYMPVLQQHGIDPMQQVSSLMKAHHTLALGTMEQKTALIREVAKDYGIDLDNLPAAPYVDPAVRALETQLQAVNNRLSEADQRAAEQRNQANREAVTKFASDPANVYFDEVADDIVLLLKSGGVKDLKDAYEKAVWANPVTRLKEQSRLAAVTAQKAKDEAIARANKARNATGANVRTSEKSGSAATPLGSIDDTLHDTLTAIRQRG